MLRGLNWDFRRPPKTRPPRRGGAPATWLVAQAVLECSLGVLAADEDVDRLRISRLHKRPESHRRDPENQVSGVVVTGVVLGVVEACDHPSFAASPPMTTAATRPTAAASPVSALNQP